MRNIEINGKYYYVFIGKIYVVKVNELSSERRRPHYNISLFEDEDMLDFVMNLINVSSNDLYDTKEAAEEKLKELNDLVKEHYESYLNENLDSIEQRLMYNKKYKKMFIEKFRYLFEGSDENESDNRSSEET